MTREQREFCKRIAIRVNEYWEGLRLNTDTSLHKAFCFFHYHVDLREVEFIIAMEGCDYSSSVDYPLAALDEELQYLPPVDGEDRIATRLIRASRRDLQEEGFHPEWCQSFYDNV